MTFHLINSSENVQNPKCHGVVRGKDFEDYDGYLAGVNLLNISDLKIDMAVSDQAIRRKRGQREPFIFKNRSYLLSKVKDIQYLSIP